MLDPRVLRVFTPLQKLTKHQKTEARLRNNPSKQERTCSAHWFVRLSCMYKTPKTHESQPTDGMPTYLQGIFEGKKAGGA